MATTTTGAQRSAAALRQKLAALPPLQSLPPSRQVRQRMAFKAAKHEAALARQSVIKARRQRKTFG